MDFSRIKKRENENENQQFRKRKWKIFSLKIKNIGLEKSKIKKMKQQHQERQTKLLNLCRQICFLSNEIEKWGNEMNYHVNYIKEYPNCINNVELNHLIEKYREYLNEKKSELNYINGMYLKLKQENEKQENRPSNHYLVDPNEPYPFLPPNYSPSSSSSSSQKQEKPLYLHLPSCPNIPVHVPVNNYLFSGIDLLCDVALANV